MTDEENKEAASELAAEGAEEQAASGESENRRARRAAAAKARKARIRERREAEAIGLDAQEMLDDAVARSTDKAGKWFRRHSNLVQWLVVGGVAIWAGWGLFDYRLANAEAEASDALAKGMRDEEGRVSEEEEEPDKNGITDPTPVFKTDEDRLIAAEKAFEAAEKYGEGRGTHAYAQLSLASVLCDEGKLDEAKALYEKVKASPLASSTPELKGLALDGLALVAETKGDKQGALKLYREMENAELEGFKPQALLQQARLNRELGKKDAAKEALKKLNELIGPPTAAFAAGYTESVAKTLTQELDPEAIQPAAPQPITADKLKALQEQMQRSIDAKKPAAPNAAKGSAGSPMKPPKLKLNLGNKPSDEPKKDQPVSAPKDGK